MSSNLGRGFAYEDAGSGQDNLETAPAVHASGQQFDVVVGTERLPTDRSWSTTPSAALAAASS